ncbi:FtsX-like permease family protein [Georgenia subflava]|uniref:FtsX-like permease family protein n=2 Tax=Georgenia subflava TaxID=1622177 RepID=A0A6N7EHB7_9MICO|nr:FtsX-like permease family protein [Georgenia subflava]
MLFAVLVLTTLQTFSVTLAQRTVTQVVGAAAPEQRAVEVVTSLGPDELTAMDDAVATLAEQLSRDVTVHLSTRSVSYGLPGRAGATEEHPDLARLAHLAGIEGHATLVDGAWPATGTGASSDDGGDGDGGTSDDAVVPAVEVAVPQAVAEPLDWQVGTTVTLANRLPTGPSGVSVTVSGIYLPDDPADPFWLGDAFANTGVQQEEFTTYGPLVTTAEDFSAHQTASSSATWRLYPDVSELTSAQLPELRRETRTLLAGLADDPALPEARVHSPIPELLATAASTRDRAATALLTPAVLLALLAGAAVALTGTLLGTLRENEDRLLVARGASRGQLLALSLRESGTVAVLAALVAGLTAPPLAARLAAAGTTEPIHAELVDAPVWLTATATAAGLGVLLVLTGARTALGPPAGTVRAARPRLAVVRRSGLDLVLVALGAVGYLQLRRHAGSETSGTDPLLVVAPALVVLAASVLCLRLLPLATRLGRRLAARSPGLPAAWAGWQADRHLPRQSGLVILLVLAVSMGSLALVHRATSAQARQDRAAHQVGADLRVDLPTAPAADSLTVEHALATGVGGENLLPVLRGGTRVGPLDDVEVLAVDADRADVMLMRPDQLGAASPAELLAPLRDARPEAAVLPLPGVPDEIVLDVTLELPGDPAEAIGVADLAVVLQDGSGLWHRVELGTLPGPGDHRLRAAVGARPGEVTGPLAVVGLVGRVPAVLPGAPQPSIAVRAFGASTDGGDPVPVGGGTDWTWVAGDARVPGDAAVRIGLREVVDAGDVEPIPAVVTPGVLTAAGVGLGETVRLPWRGGRLPVRLSATVDSLPTLAAGQDGVLVDLRSVVALGATVGTDGIGAEGLRSPERIVQWWMDLPADAAGGLDDALLAELPPGTRVLDRASIVEDRARDPLSVGMSSALVLVTFAALVLAGLGYAATAVVHTRRQRGELAVLHSLGARPRSVRVALLLERVVLVAITTALGLVLGTLAAVAVAPLTVLSTDPTTPVPPVLVAVPWAALAGLGALVVGLLAAVTLTVVRPLPPAQVVGELRRGETT